MTVSINPNALKPVVGPAGSVWFQQSGTGAVPRSSQDKMGEIEVSLMDFMSPAQKSDILAGTASIDVSSAINSTLLAYAATPGTCIVRAPSGKYRIESTVTAPEHVRLVGDSSDAFGAGSPGTEFAWYGPSGSTAVITSTGDNNDWTKGSIENLRVKNYTATTTGYGLKVRNPQNGSFLRNVHVSGFPERQCYVYEPVGRVGAGTCPGFFIIDSACFFTGGIIPLEIQCSVEQILVMGFGVDTDANSTMGIKVTKAPAGATQRAPIKFLGGKVEIQQVSPDIDGIVWDQDLAVSFDTVAVQRNNSIGSAKAAFHYTGTTRNWPTAQMVNCTSWNLQDLWRFEAAGISNAAALPGTPQSFSFRPSSADIPHLFGRETLTAGLSSASLYAGVNVNAGAQGLVVNRRCVVTGMAFRHSAAITADTITIVITKNGGTFVASTALNSANQSRFLDYTDLGNTINSANFLFQPGDRLQMQITTGATLAPTGGHVIGEVFMRPI